MACTINPFIAYIDTLIATHTANPSLSYTTLMTTASNPPAFLNVGAACDVCFSDCGVFAFLGPMYNYDGDDPLLLCYNIMGGAFGAFPKGCCENYDISSIGDFTVNNIPNDSNNYQSELCCNNFNTCSAEFTNIIQKYLFTNPSDFFSQYTFGIREYATINANSSICLLNAKILTFSDADKLDFLNGFYRSGGFVAYKYGDNIEAGTVKGFLNWW